MSDATVTEHAVWWLWPHTCLLRYPGRGNFMIFQVLPAGPDRTVETWDFFLESAELNSRPWPRNCTVVEPPGG